MYRVRDIGLEFHGYKTPVQDGTLAPVGKSLLPRFPSRCCPSGTKGGPLVPVRGTRAKASLLTPVGMLKGSARVATLQDPLTPVSITNRC